MNSTIDENRIKILDKLFELKINNRFNQINDDMIMATSLSYEEILEKLLANQHFSKFSLNEALFSASVEGREKVN